jgi:hypothetical protein
MKPLLIKISFWFSILLIFIPCAILPQTAMEEILLENLEDAAASELLEQIESFRENPMDLNQTDPKTLESFPLLSPITSRSIYEERNQHGLFRSWEDFGRRLNIDPEILKQLKPYFVIKSASKRKTQLFQSRFRFQKQIETSEGYKSGAYPGSSWKIYQRHTFLPTGHIYGGLITEKDPGETAYSDHFAGYIGTDRIPGIDHFLFGNFVLEFGQGLVLWGPYGYAKSADPIAPVKKRIGRVKRYVCSDENSALTGIAMSSEIRCGGEKIHQFKLFGFVSKTMLDASLLSDSTVGNLSTSGLHRSETEQSKKNALEETLYGGRISTEWSWGNIGFAGWSGKYSKTIRNENMERNYFDLQGTKNHVIGLDYNFYLGRWNLSGETARSRSGGMAWIVNQIMDLKKCVLALSCRRYDPDFQNPRSRGFGNGDTQNEEGIYLGFSGRMDSRTKLNLYFDIYRNPWRSYLIPVPTSGNDLLIQIERRFSQGFTFLLRSRFRKSSVLLEGATTNGHLLNMLRNRMQNQVRIELRFKPSPELRFKTRFETVNLFYPKLTGEVRCSESREKGFLLFHEMNLKTKSRFQFTARWITFDTDSYDSRIYAFENDLPGVLTIKPLYAQGIRWFLLMRWQPIRSCTLSFKYSTTYHDSVTEWGTGNDQIEGDSIHQFGFQTDLRF